MVQWYISIVDSINNNHNLKTLNPRGKVYLFLNRPSDVLSTQKTSGVFNKGGKMNIHERMRLLQRFAETLEKQQLERLHEEGITYEGHEKSATVSIKEGNKYTKIDIGSSGKYMIDREGNIFGIKAYGVIHRGHHYGTLETVNDYYWGGYEAIKIEI